MIESEQEIRQLISDFEARTLPKANWTHHAHLLVALWYLSTQSYEHALETVKNSIRAYNEAVGTQNTDTGGYHETLTQLFMRGVYHHLQANRGLPIEQSYSRLLQSPLANREWPLKYFDANRLFSVEARRQWIEPDRPLKELS